MKRLTRVLAAAVLAISSLLPFGIPMTSYAASGSDTCTWTGGGSDSKFSTAANWSGCSGAAPVNGDSLTFDRTSLTDNKTIENDITNLQVTNLVFSGTNNNYTKFEVQGNDFTLKGNVTSSGNYTDIAIRNNIVLANGTSANHNITSTYFLMLYGVISGTGNLILEGPNLLMDNSSNTFVGDVTFNGNTKAATTLGSTSFGSPSNHIYLNDNTSLSDGGDVSSSHTIPYPITFNTSATQNLSILNGKTLTLSGNITLQKDVSIGLTSDGIVELTGGIVKLTGGLSGAHSINVAGGTSSKMSLVIASSPNTSKTKNGTYKSAHLTTTFKDNQPSYDVGISDNNTILVDGVRRNVYVYDNGILGGTGTIGNLTINENGVVSPGHSPGCLSTQNEDWHAGSIYVVQLQGSKACSQYDQLKVTGTVKLNLVKLNLDLLSGFKAKAGDSFTIINNDGKDKVNGTFANLKEGATFAVDSYVFKISYVGGDGNDVVLTVQSVPSAPDTGFMLLKSSPLTTLLATTVAAGGMFLVARRTRRFARKR